MRTQPLPGCGAPLLVIARAQLKAPEGQHALIPFAWAISFCVHYGACRWTGMRPVPASEPRSVWWYASVAVRDYRGDNGGRLSVRLGQLGRVLYYPDL